MNRKFVQRGRPVEGVYRRCTSSCPQTACNASHKWEYLIELPGIDGQRRQIKKGGFATGKDASAARAEVLRKEREGIQPKNHKLTVAQWLATWLKTQEEVRGLGDGTLIDYKRHVFKYWIPVIGKLKLAELRPHHVTETLGSIKARRDKEREEALKANDAARAVAAEKDQVRVAKGLKRSIKPSLVRVPRPFGAGTAQKVHATLRAALNAAVRAPGDHKKCCGPSGKAAAPPQEGQAMTARTARAMARLDSRAAAVSPVPPRGVRSAT